ncbi:tyrosinase central domain containing protein [Nitzschia inconspicua]|uniref:Tyrosinase central domain containing protein n=1 Tax=Nitzschia inconspicua TaxID=303405 RepID=A0A9K3LNV3_9STRA|nr:tyrosinase central domain containing protein [Nitzschia inconspicua]
MKNRMTAMTTSGVLFLVTLWTTTTLHVTEARDCQRSWRRAWRDMTCQEQDDFLDAITRMKESGIYDEFVHVHQYFAEETHGTPVFLPWHRWFVWQFEKAMQQEVGRCIYLPYWDWERDAEWESESDVFDADTFGRWRATTRMNRKNCVDEGIASVWDTPFQWSLGIDGGPEGCLERRFMSGFSFEGEAGILATITNFERYARRDGFRTTFEVGPHTLVHGIVGGHMETHWSCADPLFWIHHSNIDRIWTMWQDYWEHDDCDVEDYVDPWHYDGDLDEVMPFSGSGADWDFDMQCEDGSWGYPTVRDVMSNDGPYMHVTYMNDHLASLLDSEPNPRLFQVAEDDVDIRCDRDRWRKRKLNHVDSNETTATMEMLPKNSLKGNINQDFFVEGVDQRPRSCRHNTLFTLEEDRDEWRRLCMELPLDTPIADRLALLAESNCNRRGNPRKDDPELLPHMMTMDMDAPLEAFECFHRPASGS